MWHEPLVDSVDVPNAAPFSMLMRISFLGVLLMEAKWKLRSWGGALKKKPYLAIRKRQPRLLREPSPLPSELPPLSSR